MSLFPEIVRCGFNNSHRPPWIVLQPHLFLEYISLSIHYSQLLELWMACALCYCCWGGLNITRCKLELNCDKNNNNKVTKITYCEVLTFASMLEFICEHYYCIYLYWWQNLLLQMSSSYIYIPQPEETSRIKRLNATDLHAFGKSQVLPKSLHFLCPQSSHGI